MSGPDVHLAEYAALKAEQGERIKARDGYMYSTIAVTVAAVAAAAQADLPDLLLAVPPACFVLGWTRLRNDAHILAIRGYLRDHLAPKLRTVARRTTAGEVVLGWEMRPRSRSSTLVQLAADMLTFVAPAVLAVIVWGVAASTTVWGWMAAVVDLVIIGGLAVLILRHTAAAANDGTGGPLTEPGS